MRQPLKELHSWLESNKKELYEVSINEFLTIIKDNKIITKKDNSIPSDGSIKRYIYDLSRKFVDVKISLSILIYDPGLKASDDDVPHPASDDLNIKIIDFIKWKKKEMVKQLENGGRITINLHDAYRFDVDFFESIIENPESFEEKFKEEISNKLECNPKVSFTNAYYPDTQPLISRDVKASIIGKLTTIQAVPTRMDSPVPAVDVASFLCNRCDTQHRVKQQSITDLVEPLVCKSCQRRGFRFIPEKSKWTDVQYMELTEPLSRLEGMMGETLDAYTEGETHLTNVGEECELTGILETIPPKRRSRVYGKKFKVYSISKATTKVELTDGDIDIIKEYAKDKNIFKMLVSSFAPFIYGYDEAKLAAILQLFRCHSSTIGGERKRGNIHILLIGDPAVSKSKFLIFMDYISPKSIYTSGKGASQAGITATAEQTEGGGWRLKAGAMVLASGGLLCMDEFNECGVEVQRGLNEGMEHGRISIAKAGITTTLNADTNILASANPIYDRFDLYKTLPEQFNIPPTTLSRFDLIFPIRDIIDKERDRKISKRIVKGWRKEFEHYEADIEYDVLTKYVQYAQGIEPFLTKEVGEKIVDYYVKTRGSGGKDTIPITARTADCLIRLSSASARIRLDKDIKTIDIELAISLYNFMLSQVAVDSESQTIDIDRIITGYPKKTRDEIRTVEGLVGEIASKSDDNTARGGDIITEAESKGIKRDKVEHSLTELKKKGVIFEPKPRRFMLTHE